MSTAMGAGAFYRTGARRGELTHMRWADLDLEAAELTITGSADSAAAASLAASSPARRGNQIA